MKDPDHLDLKPITTLCWINQNAQRNWAMELHILVLGLSSLRAWNQGSSSIQVRGQQNYGITVRLFKVQNLSPPTPANSERVLPPFTVLFNDQESPLFGCITCLDFRNNWGQTQQLYPHILGCAIQQLHFLILGMIEDSAARYKDSVPSSAWAPRIYALTRPPLFQGISVYFRFLCINSTKSLPRQKCRLHHYRPSE